MDNKPNIILFFTDQQRWDTTGVHGNPLGLTPNFDRAARAGTHLFNNYTCQPVCLPARSCLQTGKYATEINCFNNSLHLDTGEKTIAHYRNNAGYETGYIGKWHLAPDDPVTEEFRGGYKYWLGANLAEFVSDAYDAKLFDNDNKESKLPGHRIDAYTDAAIRYIDEKQKDPFFLMLSFLEPHHQNKYDSNYAPDGYREQYTGRWTPPDLATSAVAASQLGGYYGSVKRLDEAFGRITDALISLNLDKNTVVIFTSDHGNHFKTRNKEYKRSCHDASIRTPAAIIGSGFMQGGQVKEMVSLIDIPPTLLDIAGIKKPDYMKGNSIKTLVEDKSNTDWPKEVFVQISGSQVARAIRTKRWKYCVHAPDKNPFTDKDSDVYVESELYDMNADPYEQNNLIGLDSLSDIVGNLRKRLICKMVEAGEKIPEIKSAESWKNPQLYNTYDAVKELLRQLRDGERTVINTYRPGTEE